MNSTLLTANMILLCTKRTVPNSWFSFPFPQKNVYSPAGTPTKSNFNELNFYGEESLAPLPTPKLQDHPLSAVCDCLFNIFAATLHTWRVSPPSTTWGRRHALVTRDPPNIELGWMLLIIPPTLLSQCQRKICVSAVLYATKRVNVMKQGTTAKTVRWPCVLHPVSNVSIWWLTSRGVKGDWVQ
jgi:hypothetical protein